MQEGLRIKVVFKDDDILSVSQKSEGLDRSWLLLNPKHHPIISDFTSYLINHFQLQHSCPEGIFLSMDGFVLPPFESTSFFKDKDVVSVTKKGGSLVTVGDTPNLVDNLQIDMTPTEKTKPMFEVFDIETGGAKIDEPAKGRKNEADDYNLHSSDLLDGLSVSEKRKASGDLHSSKKKKKRNIDAQPELIKESKQDLTAKKSSKKQKKSESDDLDEVENDGETAEMTENNLTMPDADDMDEVETDRETAEMTENNLTKPDATKNDQIQESGKELVAVTAKPEKIKKGPSKSSKRQYAKRSLLKEVTKFFEENANSQLEAFNTLKEMQSKDGKEEAVDPQKGHQKWQKGRTSGQRQEEANWKQKQTRTGIQETSGQPKGLLHWKELPCKDMAKDMGKHEHANLKSLACDEPVQNGDIDDAIVPVEVMPCSDLSAKEQGVQQNQAQGENFGVNGINQENDQNLSREKLQISQRNEIKESHKESSEKSSAEKYTHGNGSIDFAKLPSLSDTPKESDVIAYRLLELSSNWTAKLSSYYVGKVLSFKSESNRVSLMPVAGYPFYSKKPGEYESTMQPDSRLYKEDGSLEVDLSSLVDVRVVKEVDACTSIGATSSTLEWSAGHNHKLTPSVQENEEVNNENKMHGGSKESGMNPWEQLSGALFAKKEQLSQQNSWGKVTPSQSSWSWSGECSGRGGFRPRGGFSGFRPRGDFSGFRPRGDFSGFRPRGGSSGFRPRGGSSGFRPRGGF